MSTRRIVLALLAACTLMVGAGVAVAVKGPARAPQPVLAAAPAEAPRTDGDLWEEAMRAINTKLPNDCSEDRASGMTDAEVKAREQLRNQMLVTMATVPPPPGWDPTNPNGVVNIHRQICPGHDHYADGKAMGMTDEAARAYAAKTQAAQQQAISSMLGRASPPP